MLMLTITGAQPASFRLNGNAIRPLERESDKALALLKSLDEKQRKQAVLNHTVPDLVLGQGRCDFSMTFQQIFRKVFYPMNVSKFD